MPTLLYIVSDQFGTHVFFCFLYIAVMFWKVFCQNPPTKKQWQIKKNSRVWLKCWLCIKNSWLLAPLPVLHSASTQKLSRKFSLMPFKGDVSPWEPVSLIWAYIARCKCKHKPLRSVCLVNWNYNCMTASTNVCRLVCSLSRGVVREGSHAGEGLSVLHGLSSSVLRRVYT